MRGVIGALFVGHGTQKLFGWFGGPGLEGASGMMENLELRPPKRHAVAAGISETAGGALASLGAGIAGSYLATSPPVNAEPEREPTGRFTRETEQAPASV